MVSYCVALGSMAILLILVGKAMWIKAATQEAKGKIRKQMGYRNAFKTVYPKTFYLAPSPEGSTRSRQHYRMTNQPSSHDFQGHFIAKQWLTVSQL